MDKLQSERLKHFPNIDFLLKISLGLILFTIISSALVYAETISVDVEGNSFDVEYTATGMTVSAIESDAESFSLFLTVDVTESTGTLYITFDRSFFDSIFEGLDDEFFILVDGDFANFDETETTSQSRTLNIEVPSGTDEVEIIGTFFGDDSSLTSIEDSEAEQAAAEQAAAEQAAAEQAAAEQAAAEQAAAEQAAAEQAAAEQAAAEQAAAEQAAAEQAAAEQAAAEQAAAEQAAAEQAAAEQAAAEQAAADAKASQTQCGPGTVLKDGACVLDERCGPGTVLKDGACVVESTSPSSETSVNVVGKELITGIIVALIVAGIIGIILGIMSKASKSKN